MGVADDVLIDDSPFAGKEGNFCYLTAAAWSPDARALETNVACWQTDSPDKYLSQLG